ncbi:metallophosphoesterase [Undibacterium sp. TJN19]|uniref:metallophosphoesterase n=1 Tax=Undibacterium sp. TJN19 TaxID=3413055 RepID=UPI003BF2BDF0
MFKPSLRPLSLSRHIYLIAAVLMSGGAIAQDLDNSKTVVNDGPYAFYQIDKNGLDVAWICNNQLQKQSFTQAADISLPALCGYPQALTIRPAPAVFPAQVQFKADRVAAFSDIHGQFELMVKLLQGNGIIGKNWQWTFGTGHLVITGDVFDRGPQTTEALWLLYALEAQAQAAGGAVHLLLGNHEAMNFSGDLRYVTKKSDYVAKQTGKTYPQLFDNNTVLGRWLRSKPAIISVNDMLFMHGGLHPDYQRLKMSVAQINEQYRASLGITKPQLKEKNDDALNFLYGSNGPLWFRGYFNDPRLSDAEVDQLLTQMQVKHIVVGHTPMNGVFAHYQGKVLSIDSGIKGGEKGEMLFWDNGKISKAGMDGQRMEVGPAPERTKSSSAP